MAIMYEFNRYPDTPTMEMKINGKTAYLSPFRGYRFQVSDTPTGCGLISESMLNTRMHELATISCGRAILSRLALDACERAKVEPFKASEFKAFIDATISWLIKNAEAIDRHNDVYQAGDKYHGQWRDLT
jgi:hypothetical protein